MRLMKNASVTEISIKQVSARCFRYYNNKNSSMHVSGLSQSTATRLLGNTNRLNITAKGIYDEYEAHKPQHWLKSVLKWRLTMIIYLFFLSGCQKETFSTSGIAEDHFFLKNGNQHMPVIVGGNLDAKKILVIIHGGPGGNSIVYRDLHVKNIVEKEFVVVYWDQRFAGNTQGNGGETDINDFRQDLKRLLYILKSKYGTDKKLYLLGHSWGGFITPYFLIDENNQNMVSGWIQVGGAHNYRMNDSLTREMLLEIGNSEILLGNNTRDWEETVNWCNDNGFEGKENAGRLNGFAHKAEGLIKDVNEPASDSRYNQTRQNALFTQWSNGISSAIRDIDLPTYSHPNSDKLSKIKLPTLLLWGKYDFVCPSGLAEDIEKNIGSNDVTKIIYPNSGHSPMMNQREEFWRDVINWVKIH